MSHESPIGNPFMLMLHPEVVLAAVENSERLSQLNRQVCRPLDRPSLPNAKGAHEAIEADEADDVDDCSEVEASERQ